MDVHVCVNHLFQCLKTLEEDTPNLLINELIFKNWYITQTKDNLHLKWSTKNARYAKITNVINLGKPRMVTLETWPNYTSLRPKTTC